ncbi:MAG TPA: VanZ family protein [Candidatus Dormibacteraeota bacterium]|nr:VanZ family protein [Candidatus Dormibacteraeota bacterium]
MRWLRNWGPVLAWAGCIWLLSTDHFSSAATGRVIGPVLSWLFPSASEETLKLLHALIRKAAHLVEYFVFSLLVFRGIRGDRRGWRLSWSLETVFLAAIYATLDEIHQAFESDRTSSMYDSLLDTAGAAAAQLLLSAFAWRQTRRQVRSAA